MIQKIDVSKASTQKKAYTAPKLVTHGDVEKLTLGYKFGPPGPPHHGYSNITSY